MMRSLYSGVAGLKTHQTKMDVIGNNIANVNTTSFKSQSITFSDLMYQTTQTASGATETKGGVNARQIGLGAKSGAINTAITSQGATQTTNNPFDIMITGNSFFIVSNGAERLFTRDGSFYIDGAGNLAMQSNGYLVQGWVAEEDRETGAIEIKNRNADSLSGLQIMSAANSTYSPASTTAALFSGNIDDHDTNILADEGKTVTLEFYDNKGYLYTGKFTLKDTATDHLYALSLTDVLDSTGNSLGKDIVKNITFGDTESTERSQTVNANEKYTFIPDATGEHMTINAEGGDVKYEKVPQAGNLADLLSTSRKSYKGILRTAYGVSEGDEAIYAQKINATYEIDPATGALTISYTDADVTNGQYATANYAFSGTNNRYFVDPATRASYRIPDSSGNAGDLNEDFLSTVFGIQNAATYVSSNYTYTYSGTELAIQKKISLQPTSANRVSYQDSPLVTAGEKDNFIDTNGGSLQAAIDAWKAEDPANNTEDKLFYKYNGTTKVLTILSDGLEDTFDDASVTLDNTDTSAENYINPDLYSVFSDTLQGLSADYSVEHVTKKIIDQITALDDADFPASVTAAGFTAQDVKDLASKIWGWAQDGMDQVSTDQIGGYTGDLSDIYFGIYDITGTPALSITYPTKQASQTPVAWDKVFTLKNETTGTLQAPYEIPSTSPQYVYKSTDNNVYAKAYSLTGTSDVFTENNNVYHELLTTVFSNNEDVQNLLNNIEDHDYKISFSGDGLVSISHNVVEAPKNTTEEYTAADNGDGTSNYTSLLAYGNVPVKGNIKDLMEATKGDYSGLLKKIYGIDDAAADAYGTDGTYEIITSAGSDNGSIKLTIGDHTIQLAFNAANGSLTTADGNSSGMVNMKFNQGFPGLEAFGFQASAANPDEADKAGIVQIDFATVTNYNTNGSSTIKAVKGDKRSLNTGRAVGEMNGVTVSTDGQIFATYSNGQTKLLGQIASAQFANASGLSKEGDNLYTSTLNSGEATIQDITVDGGYMNTGVLEMSNVDLSSQFTEMITTQRGFQANSRIITVSDTLLEELTNLKR